MSSPSKAFVACLAASASVAVVAVGAANLTSLTGSVSSDQSGLPSVPASSLELGVEAREVFEAFNGTRLQRDASGVLQAWALNGGVDGCMGARGYPEWDWSGARNYAPDVDPLANSTFFAEPLGDAVSETVKAIRPRIVAEEELMSDDPDVATAEAIGDCIESTPTRSDDAFTQEAQPPHVNELREAWWRLMYDLDEQFGDVKSYNVCMSVADLSILKDQRHSVEELDQALDSVVPSANQIPTSSGDNTDNSAWQRFLSVEREVAEADWSCRADVYHAHVADVREAVAGFASEHANQINAALLGWQEIEVRALELGFNAQTGQFAPR